MNARTTLDMMREVDSAIGQLLDAVDETGLRDQVVVLITTDHGMVEAGEHLNIGAVVRRSGVRATIAAEGTIAHLYLDDPSSVDEAKPKLAGSPYFEVIDPRSPPAFAQIGNSPRVGQLVLSMYPPYLVFDQGYFPWYLRWAGTYGRDDILPDKRFKAMHGYRPDTPGMESVFYAWGADIPASQRLDGMRTIDVHPTVTRLLGIEPGSPVDARAFDALFPVAKPVQTSPTKEPAAFRTGAQNPVQRLDFQVGDGDGRGIVDTFSGSVRIPTRD